MEKRKYTREDAIRLLQSKRRQLLERGEDRLPKRSDFTEAEVVAIKAFLGPWPRALEVASLEKKQQ